MWKGVVFVCLLALAAYYWIEYRTPTPAPTKITDIPNDSYDYVIVGAGSAGCVLANRLSEDPTKTVLILEAGNDDALYPAIHVPSDALLIWGNKEVDWFYKTEPQKHALRSMKGQQAIWPRGKVLGGTGSLNSMAYVRGSPHDYDRWASLGAKGWSYKDVLPYFKKAENNQNPEMVASGYHGDQGPFVVSDVNLTVISEAFLQAAEELGYRRGDLNGEEHEDTFMHMQANVKNGVRWSTAAAYLRPAQYRPNLHITTAAHVTKVVFSGKRAIGVLYKKNGETRTVRSKLEVILSGGAVNSPQILMLSGVGPKKHLEDLGISIVADLPVGENLEDHLMFLSPEFTVSIPGITSETMLSRWTEWKYKLFRSGLKSAAGLDGVGFVKVPHQPKEDKFSHAQLMLNVFLFGTFDMLRQQVASFQNMKEEISQAIYGDADGLAGFLLFSMLNHPKSTGSITLNTKNPFDAPKIDPNYLVHNEDVQSLLHAVRVSQKLATTKAMQAIGVKMRQRVHPSCKHHQYDSDAYWECAIREHASTVFHPSTTCKMGAPDDKRAVVDPELRVIGIDGLRVADASVFPNTISGNLHATVIMVAEKAADIISKAQN